MIYITGHKGFIGSYLCKHLDFYEIPYVGVDIKDGLDYRDFNWSVVDSCDTIIHLAAISDVTKCEENSKEAFDINTAGISKMKLDGCCPRFIFASSAAAINPINVYGYSKLGAECFIKKEFQKHAILRFFNVTGDFPGRKDFTSIVKQSVKNNEYIDIYGPENTRNFVSVKHVVEVIIDHVFNPHKKGTFEVGSERSVTLLEHAISLGATKIRVHPPKPHDIIHSHLTI